MREITNYLKNYGFLVNNAEIYQGLSKLWDLGPNGVNLKNNIKNIWWKYFITCDPLNIGIDSCIITSPKVLEASGHKKNFCDWLTSCENCKKRYRLDDLIGLDDLQSLENSESKKNEIISKLKEIDCPDCKKKELAEPKKFNLLLSTNIGSVEKKSSTVYFRPETCQGIFVNFLSSRRSSRRKIPFGIGQIGKSFRNEITLNHGIFRTREFEQMELEFFCEGEESEKWWSKWNERSWKFLSNLTRKKDNIKYDDLDKNNLPHYSIKTRDFFFKYDFGWGELCSNSHRGDYDLKNHGEFSNKNFLTESGKIPEVVEISFGVERLMLALLQDSYENETLNENSSREVLKLHPLIAPYFVAIIPLKKSFRDTSDRLYTELLKNCIFNVTYEETDSIGKSYRRQDSIGTYFCVTVDSENAETVTLRKRDNMNQIRIDGNKILEHLKKEYEKEFLKFIS